MNDAERLGLADRAGEPVEDEAPVAGVVPVEAVGDDAD